MDPHLHTHIRKRLKPSVFTKPHSPHGFCVREEPLMIWGGPGQKWEKKLNGAGKKTQLNNPEEKVQRLVAEEKKSSTASCRGKKKLNTNYLPGPPPRSLMVRP